MALDLALEREPEMKRLTDVVRENQGQFMNLTQKDPQQKATYLLLDGKPYTGSYNRDFKTNKYFTGVRFSESSRKLTLKKDAVPVNETVQQIPELDRELRTYENFFTDESMLEGFAFSGDGSMPSTGGGIMSGVALPFATSSRTLQRSGVVPRPSFGINTIGGAGQPIIGTGGFVNQYDLDQQGVLLEDGTRIRGLVPQGINATPAPSAGEIELNNLLQANLQEVLKEGEDAIESFTDWYNALPKVTPPKMRTLKANFRSLLAQFQREFFRDADTSEWDTVQLRLDALTGHVQYFIPMLSRLQTSMEDILSEEVQEEVPRLPQIVDDLTPLPDSGQSKAPTERDTSRRRPRGAPPPSDAPTIPPESEPSAPIRQEPRTWTREEVKQREKLHLEFARNMYPDRVSRIRYKKLLDIIGADNIYFDIDAWVRLPSIKKRNKSETAMLRRERLEFMNEAGNVKILKDVLRRAKEQNFFPDMSIAVIVQTFSNTDLSTAFEWIESNNQGR